MRIVVVVLLLAVTSGVAGAANHPAKDLAYRSARTCLLHHGAVFVGRRPDGGGFATFRNGSTFWTYKEELGGMAVSSVTVYFAGIPGPSAATKRAVDKCLQAGVL